MVLLSMLSLSNNITNRFDRVQITTGKESYRKPYPSNMHPPKPLPTDNVSNRYEQITAKLRGILSATVQRDLAHFIESQLAQIACATHFTFKKKLWGITHSLLINQGSIYIKNIKSLGSGSFKQVKAALALPLQQNEKTANLVALAASKEGMRAEDLPSATKEMEIHQALKNVPGIWPIHFWFQHTSDRNPELEKVVSVLDIADGDLACLSGPTSNLTLKEEFLLSQILIMGLYNMHIRGLIHGDIKDRNALFRRDTNGRLTAGLTDFGHTFYLDSDEPHNVYRLGFYGTLRNSAPELFGNTDFTNQDEVDYFKTDIWAFGIMLYQLHFKKSPPWVSVIDSCCEKNTNILKEVTDWDRNKIEEMVQKSIERPLARLNSSKELNEKEQFERLIYQLLRFDPAKRIDAREALSEIATIIRGNTPDKDDCCIIS